MERVIRDAGHQFAMELLEDIETNKILEDCMVNHADEFTGDMEVLHRRRFGRSDFK